MFKKLETSWNSHTPVYLHNGTKENIIFQLMLSVILCGGMLAYGEYKDLKEERDRYKAIYHETKDK